MASYKKEQNCVVTLNSTLPKICHVFALSESSKMLGVLLAYESDPQKTVSVPRHFM